MRRRERERSIRPGEESGVVEVEVLELEGEILSRMSRRLETVSVHTLRFRTLRSFRSWGFRDAK